MIDFHSHILPNIDDGSRNIDQSVQIIREAQDAGFSKIIATSHYIEEYYECNEQDRKQLIEQIKKQVSDVDIVLGNEIFFTENMIELIREKKASTINNSRYILFELPMNSRPMNVKEIVYKLIEEGYVPIIAHPERYIYVQENIEYVKELAEMGALFQSNYGSIIGMYGKKAEKTMKKLLKENLIQFLGSDVHYENQIYTKIDKCIKKIKKILSDEELEKLTTINAQKVLNNENI